MGKTMVVKIATNKVITALENALAKLEADYALSQANEEKFQKAKEKWQMNLATLALKQIAKAERLSVNQRYDGTLNVDFYLPAGVITMVEEPSQKDYPTLLYRHNYDSQKEEIENALRILKMTDDEVVPASTLGSISRYL